MTNAGGGAPAIAPETTEPKLTPHVRLERVQVVINPASGGVGPKAAAECEALCRAFTTVDWNLVEADPGKVDQAVADGVDVINYSVSGSQTNFADAVEIAFLFAADAGVRAAAPGRAGLSVGPAHRRLAGHPRYRRPGPSGRKWPGGRLHRLAPGTRPALAPYG